jgi:hypothetical protein
VFHKRPPVFDFSPNPADRVPVHVKFKAAELFINKYGISMMWLEESRKLFVELLIWAIITMVILSVMAITGVYRRIEALL